METPVSISLTRGLDTIVDATDAERVIAAGKWHATPSRYTFYARRNFRRADGTRGTLLLHSLLTGFEHVDHINGNGLDNRRTNLRAVTNAQNQYNRRRQSNNTSGFVGVNWFKPRGRWVARIKHQGVQRFLGYYDTAEDAARARDAAAIELHGSEFARLNFPTSDADLDVIADAVTR